MTNSSKLWVLGFSIALTFNSAAQTVGTASGEGSITTLHKAAPDAENQMLSQRQTEFKPKFSVAYIETKRATQSMWIVLTEKTPPLKALLESEDRFATLESWCKGEKTAFVALKLEAKSGVTNGVVDLYFLNHCKSEKASTNTEMLSSTNGLDSVKVHFTQNNAKRLEGSLIGGAGNCPLQNGDSAYCEQRSNYVFNAPILSN